MGLIFDSLLVFFGLIFIVVMLLLIPSSIWDVTDLLDSYLLVLPILAVIGFGLWWLRK